MAVAADANLLLFALNEMQPPLKTLLNWLNHWAANRNIKDVAVTLLGPSADTAAPLRNELERFARRHGLAFLGADETWDERAASASFGPKPDRDLATELELPPVLEPVPVTSHWDIND